MTTTVALRGGGSPPPVVELTSKAVAVHHRRALGRPLEVPRRQILAVVDLRAEGAARYGLCGPRPLRRPPAIGVLPAAGGRDPHTVALVFRQPPAVPTGAARRLGLKSARGEQATLDVLELAPTDPDELLDALGGAGVAEAASVGGALARTIGTIDDPELAAGTTAARTEAVRRSTRLSQAAVSLPLVVLALAAIVGPSDLRAQILLLLGVWVGIAVVLGRTLAASNRRAAARLGPPPDLVGDPPEPSGERP